MLDPPAVFFEHFAHLGPLCGIQAVPDSSQAGEDGSTIIHPIACLLGVNHLSVVRLGDVGGADAKVEALVHVLLSG